MLKWGGTQSFEVVLTWGLTVLAILKGGGGGVREGFHHLRKALPCLERGGPQKVSEP